MVMSVQERSVYGGTTGAEDDWRRNYDSWIPVCPECSSKDIEPLNLYRGMYKDKHKNEQKMKCNECGYIWWKKL